MIHHSNAVQCARRVVAWLLALLVATGWTISAQAQPPQSAPPQAADELVLSVRSWEGEYFSRDRPGGVDSSPVVGSIYTIRDDGSELRRVAQPGGDANAAAFSADGEWIYFQSNASGSHQLYRCRTDGGGLEQLTSAERLGPPWTSAYGLQITASGQLLATVYDGASGRVALLSADASRLEVIAPELGYLYMAALSPQADTLVCAGPASEYCLLRLIRQPATTDTAAGWSAPLNLTPDQPHCYAPQFTPDGQTIIYVQRDGDVYRVQRDGSGRQRLTEGNAYVEFRLSPQDRHGSTDGPRLSPDGHAVAYLAVRDGVANVWRCDVAGGGARQVTFRDQACGRVQWSPDGKRISFVSFEGRYPQLFVVDRDGGEPRRLTQLVAAVYWVQWKPRPKDDSQLQGH